MDPGGCLFSLEEEVDSISLDELKNYLTFVYKQLPKDSLPIGVSARYLADITSVEAFEDSGVAAHGSYGMMTESMFNNWYHNPTELTQRGEKDIEISAAWNCLCAFVSAKRANVAIECAFANGDQENQEDGEIIGHETCLVYSMSSNYIVLKELDIIYFEGKKYYTDTSGVFYGGNFDGMPVGCLGGFAGFWKDNKPIHWRNMTPADIMRHLPGLPMGSISQSLMSYIEKRIQARDMYVIAAFAAFYKDYNGTHKALKELMETLTTIYSLRKLVNKIDEEEVGTSMWNVH